ncbi:MAG: energy transducer TonB [Pseudomonadota bacterium]|nr:energy transducer TonB [Pseudomonadota bacterium]
MSASSPYLEASNSGKRPIGLAIAVLAHVILIYGLLNGLGRKVIEVIKQPLETKIIEEVKPPPPPPPEAPPPPPKLAAPPPPFIPPPEIKISAPPPPAPTITAVVQEPPPAPVAPIIQKPAPVEVQAAPKPAPPPPPPAPKPRFRTNVRPVYVPPVEELVAAYPRQAAREGITGRVIVHITVAPSGDVKDAVVKESQPKRTFDKVALEYVKRYKFEKGDDEFETEQEIVFKLD